MPIKPKNIICSFEHLFKCLVWDCSFCLLQYHSNLLRRHDGKRLMRHLLIWAFVQVFCVWLFLPSGASMLYVLSALASNTYTVTFCLLVWTLEQVFKSGCLSRFFTCHINSVGTILLVWTRYSLIWTNVQLFCFGLCSHFGESLCPIYPALNRQKHNRYLLIWTVVQMFYARL